MLLINLVYNTEVQWKFHVAKLLTLLVFRLINFTCDFGDLGYYRISPILYHNFMRSFKNFFQSRPAFLFGFFFKKTGSNGLEFYTFSTSSQKEFINPGGIHEKNPHHNSRIPLDHFRMC